MDPLPNLLRSPPWWQLINWIADPLGFQARCRAKHGDTFTLRLGQVGTVVVLANPQDIQEVFSQDFKFDAGVGNMIAKPLLGENSIIVIDGERHRRERKLLMPAFHRERLPTYATQICQIAEQASSEWKLAEPFVARTAIQKISLEVILQVVFGLAEGERYSKLKNLLIDWINMTSSPIRSSLLFFPFLQQNWGPWGRVQHLQGRIYNLLLAEIEVRRQHIKVEGADILSLMMAARDENGEPMSEPELCDELLTLLFAGHETTATIIAWAFYQLHRQPDILDQLRRELDSLGVDPAPMAMAQLPYLSAVCQETLRMYPVIPGAFFRNTRSAITIGGHRYEKDTLLMPSIYLVHHREDLYPDPKKFKPERFIGRQYSASEFLPFGGGVRRCIGYALAELEIKLVIATILSGYELRLKEDQPVLPERRGFGISAKGGIRMVMVSRR